MPPKAKKSQAPKSPLVTRSSATRELDLEEVKSSLSTLAAFIQSLSNQVERKLSTVSPRRPAIASHPPSRGSSASAAAISSAAALLRPEAKVAEVQAASAAFALDMEDRAASAPAPADPAPMVHEPESSSELLPDQFIKTLETILKTSLGPVNLARKAADAARIANAKALQEKPRSLKLRSHLSLHSSVCKAELEAERAVLDQCEGKLYELLKTGREKEVEHTTQELDKAIKSAKETFDAQVKQLIHDCFDEKKDDALRKLATETSVQMFSDATIIAEPQKIDAAKAARVSQGIQSFRRKLLLQKKEAAKAKEAERLAGMKDQPAIREIVQREVKDILKQQQPPSATKSASTAKATTTTIADKANKSNKASKTSNVKQPDSKAPRASADSKEFEPKNARAPPKQGGSSASKNNSSSDSDGASGWLTVTSKKQKRAAGRKRTKSSAGRASRSSNRE